MVRVVTLDSETRRQPEEAEKRDADVEGDGDVGEDIEELETVAPEAGEEVRQCCCCWRVFVVALLCRCGDEVVRAGSRL